MSAQQNTRSQAVQSDENGYFHSVDVPFDGHTSNDELEESEGVIFESVSQNPYEVSYTCLILPRSNVSDLSGELTDCIQVVMKQISNSFGWKLDFLSVQSDYLQWTFRVPPSTSTTYVIQVVRDQTSQRIFADYPDMVSKNGDEDFWAPGYLLFWGSQPHPAEVIQQYIHLTRQQQGFSIDE